MAIEVEATNNGRGERRIGRVTRRKLAESPVPLLPGR